ncbi:MAG: tail protein X [Halocynthiibacter sp.]
MSTYTTIEGDMIDAICKDHYGTETMLETVMDANPGLSRLGPKLPRGVTVLLPPKPADKTKTPLRLWG